MFKMSIPPIEYRPRELTRATFVRGGDGWGFHQGPRFTRFSDGRLMMHWGVYDMQECSNDGAVVYSLSTDEGASWSDPKLWMKSPNAVSSHLSILELDDGKVLMAGTEGHYVGASEDAKYARVTKWADYASTRLTPFIRRSPDGGTRWTIPEEIPSELVTGRPVDSFYGAPYQILRLSSGMILLTIPYLHPDHMNPQHYNVAILSSADDGDSWQKSADFTVPETRGAMEPKIVEVEPDELYCVMRNKSGFLYEMRSTDGGKNWEDPQKTSIPAPESLPQLIKLESGRLLLVWNNQSSTTQRPRYPLAASVSADGGRSWDEPRILANEIDQNQLSNHDVIQLPDGRIIVGVSHYRAQRPACSDIDLYLFDEAWLDGEGR